MNREEKAAVVDELAAQIEGAEAIFAVDYRGISVPQAAELRAKLREADARFRVVKNRLTLRAVEKAGIEELKGVLDGPTAFTFVSGDAVIAAKALAQFRREHDILEYKGGLMDGAVLEPEQFGLIARLPGREGLNAQLAAVVASPLTGLVRGLAALISGLAIQLKQIEEQGLVSGSEAVSGSDSPAAEITEDLPETETAELAGEPDPEPAGEAPTEPDEEAAGEPASEPGDDTAAAAEEQPEETEAPEAEEQTSETDDTNEED